jgi:subtilisin family serine protease
MLGILLMPMLALSQDSAVSYWFRFADKANSTYSIYRPSAYLSDKAIQHRNTLDIGFDKRDLPVTPSYKQGLADQTQEVVITSKWLNGAVARVSDSGMLRSARSLPFVDTAYRVKGKSLTTAALRQSAANSSLQYGAGRHQIAMLNGQFLHQLGYQGEGIGIGVLDAGFRKADDLTAFQYLRSSGKLQMKRNYVNPGEPVTAGSNHGTTVLSVMGALSQDTFTGVAPEANYHLLKSENPESEFLVEEIAWVAAAEAADSAGARIINSSLGYTTFEDSTTSHTYQALDGKTTLVSRGAAIAADKGMLVVSSAGNKGNSAWQYISTPADGQEVLTVGAVDSAQERVSFSSAGPSADGRIKPDIMALGAKTTVISPSTGEPAISYGTSFSAPLISGLAACLWQAFPEASNKAIRRAIVQSGSQAQTPDTLHGYGVPDFYEAYVQLQNQADNQRKGSHLVRLYPNPFHSQLSVAFYSLRKARLNISIRPPAGDIVYQKQVELKKGLNRIKLRNLSSLKSGVYVLNLTNDQTQIARKLLRH